jgi:hypothetical protein
MNARERLTILTRTDRSNMTVWSPGEVREALDAFRAEVLREAAERIEAKQKRSDDHEVSRFGKLDHESVLERDAVLAAVAELRLMADAVSGGTGGDEQAETEARPRSIRWRVEIYDPLAKEWAPGAPFLVRERAVERLNVAQIYSPRWADDETPVTRRLVRETTTYTIEAGESR